MPVAASVMARVTSVHGLLERTSWKLPQLSVAGEMPFAKHALSRDGAEIDAIVPLLDTQLTLRSNVLSV
jgi:hypothetical protein